MVRILAVTSLVLTVHFLAPIHGCDVADIVFLIDSSGSVGSRNFAKVKDFLQAFCNAFTIGPSDVQFSVVDFSSSVHDEFHLNAYPNKPSLLNAVAAIPYISGGTNTQQALEYVASKSFTPDHGDRPNAPNFLIVLTDGKSQNPQATALAAQKVHASHITTSAIGVGSGVDTHELRTIATNLRHVFSVSNFDALRTLQSELHNITCTDIQNQVCQDTIPDCSIHIPTKCFTDVQWAQSHCKKSCLFCGASTVSPPGK